MKWISLIFLCCFVVNTTFAQFYVQSNTDLHITGQTDLYTDIELINNGNLGFSSTATGGMFVDAGLDNSNGTLTLNDAILYLGSDTSSADGNHNLIFSSNDSARFVELGMNNGTYTVTGGLLNITKTFTSNSGTLEANDGIVLKSTSIQNTALVPESTAGTVNSIRVERYIPAERAWRIMASPVTTDDFMFENWQQNGLEPGDTGYRQNIGTHITGGTAADGFDQSSTNNASLFIFDEQNQQWNTLDNTNATKLENSVAYFILIRGDRSIDLMTNDTSEIETTLEQTGSLHIGNKSQSYSVPSGDSFVTTANPYQAPADMNQVIGGSDPTFKNQIWIWVQTDTSSGQFVNIDDLSNPTPNVPGSNVTEDLQPGQSGFIQTKSSVSGNISLTYEETDKVDENSLTETFSESTDSNSVPDGFLRIGLYDINSTAFDDVAHDGIILRFDGQYNNSVDDSDGMKLFNSDESLALLSDNNYLSVNNRQLPVDLEETIDLHLFNLDDSQYNFSIELNGFTALPNGIFLWDKYLDTYTNLNDQDIITFNVDASIPASIAQDRFALVFEDETMGIADNSLGNISLYPNPVINDKLFINFSQITGNTKIKVDICSLDGKIIRSRTFDNVQQKIELSGLDFSTGVYLVKVRQGDKRRSFKIIKE